MPKKRPVPKLREMLQGIIAAPSVSSVSPEFDMSNHAVASEIAGWLEAIGCAVELMEIPGYPGKFNVIGTLGDGPGGLVLAGHMDTVPCDEHRWDSDPFKLTERDGNFHGLGICDMKSFIALAIEAASQYANAEFAQPLIILATADEESSMSGGRALVAAGRPKGRYAVIGEPTNLRPVHLHKGILMEAIRVVGQPGHSSDPTLGSNALEGMHRIIGGLLEYRDELRHHHHDNHFAVPVPTLNLGHIKGGDNPNRICPECELHIDIRTLPGMQVETVRSQFQQRVRSALGDNPCTLEFRSLFEGVNPLETPANSAIVRAAERLTGHGAEAVAFSTEAPFLQALGMQTVVMGPGDIRVAHQHNESLPLSMINPTLEILDQLIRQFCLTQTAVASM